MPAKPASSSRSVPQRFNVYKVRYGPVTADPDVRGVRYHNIIFVETAADGSGTIHHVTGDLVIGFHYENKKSPRPEISKTFFAKDFIGTVLASTYPSAVENICKKQPAPPRQKAFNKSTMKTEPFKPDGSFYEPGEARRPLIKCTEWTEQQAIPALLRANVVQRTEAISFRDQSTASSGPSSTGSSSRGSATQSSSRSQPSSGQGHGNDSGSANWVWDDQQKRYRRFENGKWIWS